MADPKVIWTEVGSSNVKAVAYCEQTQNMGVEFTSGALYSYKGVDMEVYSGLVGAQSVGQYFDRVIKKSGMYDYERFHSREGLEVKLKQS